MNLDPAIQAVQACALAVIGVFTYLNSRKSDKIVQIVDGPLSLALKEKAETALENYMLKRKIAELSGKPDDFEAAAIAKIRSDEATAIQRNREQGKAMGLSITSGKE